MNLIRRALRWLAKNRPESRRWLGTPAGCCECGTGGPYYAGDPQTARTRYVYTDACGESDGTPDWSSCSEHSLTEAVPVVDYGRDVVVTFRQAEADTARKLADRAAGWTCPLADCHTAIGRPKRHTHPRVKQA